MIRFRRRRVAVGEPLRRALGAQEAFLAHAVTVDGVELAATRQRLMMLAPDSPVAEPFSIPWWRLAKARLDGGTLTLTPLQQVGELPGGGLLMVDDEPLRFTFDRPTRLTDQVHQRVRRSVAGSRHLPWPGAGGWVSLRRVAGQDGMTLQLRLDAGADPAVPGFLEAALRVGAELLGSGAQEITGVDE